MKVDDDFKKYEKYVKRIKSLHAQYFVANDRRT